MSNILVLHAQIGIERGRCDHDIFSPGGKRQILGLFYPVKTFCILQVKYVCQSSWLIWFIKLPVKYFGKKTSIGTIIVVNHLFHSIPWFPIIVGAFLSHSLPGLSGWDSWNDGAYLPWERNECTHGRRPRVRTSVLLTVDMTLKESKIKRRQKLLLSLIKIPKITKIWRQTVVTDTMRGRRG